MSFQLQHLVFVPAVASLLYKLYNLHKIEEEKECSKPQITGIYIYPIKSCRGISLNTGKIGVTGFEYDRTWMVVDAATNRFITQRQAPPMATIVPVFAGDYLIVNAPSMEPLKIPLVSNKRATLKVGVWDDNVMAIEESEEVSAWFSKFLGKAVKLVRVDPKEKRIADPVYWTEDIPGAKLVSFADGFPFLVVSEESVDFVNQNIEGGPKVTFRRFRPNILVKGAKVPFEEDTWKTFSIRGMVFHGVKDCARCKITTVDQDSGVVTGPEPLATLHKVHKRGDNGFFGQNVVHESTGYICVGDRIDVKPVVLSFAAS